MIDTIINGLDKFNGSLTKATGLLATILLIIMTGIVTLHVIMRYCFDYSFVWTEETARYLMVWMAFLFFPTGHKKGMNVSVEFMVSWWAHTKAGILLRLLIEAALLVLLLFAVKLSFSMMDRGEHTLSQALQIPMIWIYAVLPVCFALTSLCSIESLLRLVRALFFGGPLLHASMDDDDPEGELEARCE